MNKRLLSCCLMLVLLGVCISGSEAAAVKKPVKASDDGGVWSAVAELATRVVRQLADDFSGEDSAEDDDEPAEIVENVALKEPAEAEQAVTEAESEEEDDDEYDDFFGRRVQRSVDQTKEHRESAAQELDNETAVTEPAKVIDSSSENSTPSTTNFSVLILIRNALKKVTTNLPAEQVASNALHYFQLFEHFLQQTIEQVIDDVDDDKDEETTLESENENVNKAPELTATESPVTELNIENNHIIKPAEIISQNLPNKAESALTEEKPANEIDNVLAAEATTISA